MNWNLVDYSFDQGNTLISPENKEVWKFTHELIETPHGNFDIDEIEVWESEKYVGLSIVVFLDHFNLPELEGCPPELHDTFVSSIEVFREHHNAWLWIKFFDDEGNNVVTFSGFDDLDGLAHFVDKLTELGENF